MESPNSQETPSLGLAFGTVLLVLAILGVMLALPGRCQICQGKGEGRPGCFSQYIPPCPACDRSGKLPAAKRFWIEARSWLYEYKHRNEDEVEVFQY